MPKPDGTMYAWERAELHNAQVRYNSAVNCCKMHARSSALPLYEATEKKAFAELMRITAKYAGCR